MKRFATIALTAAILAAPSVSFAGSFDGDESVIIFERTPGAAYHVHEKNDGALAKLKQRRVESLSERVDISE